MAKDIVNMNGKTMTHKLTGVTGVVTGTGVFSQGEQLCLRYVSGDEMREIWFPKKELALAVPAAKKTVPSTATGKKRGRPAGSSPTAGKKATVKKTA